MALITKTHTFSAGATIIASEHNTNFDTLYSCINGSISNANISNSAAIAYSKLNLTGLISNADISSSAAIAYSKLNLALGIVNADISASAAIVDTKLAQIATASKVSGAALTSLSSIPVGAGQIPTANLSISLKQIFSGQDKSLAAGTSYITIGDSSTSAGNATIPISAAGTMKKLYLYTSDTNLGTVVATVKKNGSDQTLVATIASTANSANDTTHEISFSAGDLYELKVENGRGAPIPFGYTVQYDPT